MEKATNIEGECSGGQGVSDPYPAARAVLLGAPAAAPGPDGEALGPLPPRATASPGRERDQDRM